MYFTDQKIMQIGRESMELIINCEKLLGAKIDTKVTFDDYIEDLCKKTNSKPDAPRSVTAYMGLAKKKSLMNSLFAIQFNYCPLIWMFHSRSSNNKITHLHERFML